MSKQNPTVKDSEEYQKLKANCIQWQKEAQKLQRENEVLREFAREVIEYDNISSVSDDIYDKAEALLKEEYE